MEDITTKQVSSDWQARAEAAEASLQEHKLLLDAAPWKASYMAERDKRQAAESALQAQATTIQQLVEQWRKEAAEHRLKQTAYAGIALNLSAVEERALGFAKDGCADQLSALSGSIVTPKP